MEKNYIPSTEAQEEALCDLYEKIGYESGLGFALSFLEKNLGPVNKLTIELRHQLYKGVEVTRLREKSKKSWEDSKVDDLLIKRLDTK